MNVRKAFSVILALCMLIGLIPAAYAQTEATTVASWTELQEALKTGGEIILQEDLVAPDGSDPIIVPKATTATIDLNGHKIDRNLINSGAGAQKNGCVIATAGKLTVTDTSAEQTGAITGGYTDGTGGGVWIRGSGSFTLAGGSITGNAAKYAGGGVYFSGDGSQFTMTGGSISGNTAKNGGGVAMDSHGSMVISGGEISGNSAGKNGGGVWIGKGPSLTVSGGAITNNSADSIGGGVYVHGSRAGFTMTDGSISGNTAKHGGGVGIYSFGSATLSGGEISGNSASVHGGGVWIGQEASCTVSGVTITGNSAEKGGGVYINKGTIEYLSGSITGNTLTDSEITSDIDAASGDYAMKYNVRVSVSGSGTAAADKATAAAGETVTLTAEPGSDDWKLGSLTVTAGGAEVPAEKQPDGTYTFTMPEADVNVGAEFGELHAISTGVDLYNSHYYEDTGCTMTADKEYAVEGETVTLTLSMAPGYVFLLGDVNRDIPLTQVSDTVFTFTMPDEEADAYAYVQKAQYTVLLGGTASSNVSFLLNYDPRDQAPFPAEYGDRVDVIFQPYDQLISGMTYTYTQNGNTVTNAISYEENDRGEWQGHFIMPDCDVTVRVEYSNIYDITEDWTNTANGIISAELTKAAEGTEVTVHAMPDECYAFSGWNFTPDVTIISDTANANGSHTATFTMPGSDVAFGAVFNRVIFEVTAETPGGHGTINGEDWGRAGENYPFTVTPDEGYSVSSVSVISADGTVGYTQNGDSYTFNMPASDVTLSATFTYGSGWSDLAALLRAGGEIVLDRDYTAASGDAALEVPEDVSVTLDLNGHTVNGNAVEEDDLLTVRGEMLLTDSGEGGKITARDCDDTVYVHGGSLVMTGGALGYTGSVYACVYIGGQSSFRLEGGALTIGSGCTAVIYNCGTFEMTGGAISGDAIDIVYNNLSDMLFTGGSIRGNVGSEEDYGYGIYLKYAELYVSGDADIDVTERRYESDPETVFDENDYDIGLSRYSMIHVIGGLSADGPQLGVNGYDGVFADGASYVENGPDYTITEDDACRFRSADPEYSMRLTDENTIELKLGWFFTVTFEPGDEGADGAMASVRVAEDSAFTLPACRFEAPEGKVFKEWSVQIGNGNPFTKDPGEEITVTDDTTVTAVYAAAPDPDQEAADTVIGLINEIGTVEYTDGCKAKIDAASDAFEALTEAQKALVTNEQTLRNAITQYNELKAAADQAAADQQAADTVIGLINEIGTVEYTDGCKVKIDAASNAFEALTEAQKALVTNEQTLRNAIDRYNELKAAADQAAADQQAADAVIGLINDIGAVEYTEACKAKIDAASDAFEALTEDQKALVTNEQTLTDAIARYNELKAAAENPENPTDPEDPTEQPGADDPQDGSLCKWCGEPHTGFWGKIVAFFHSILYFFAHLFGRK